MLDVCRSAEYVTESPKPPTQDKVKEDSELQLIAAEMNLSETAFLTERNNNFATADTFGLRWLTPTAESRLCGHATLASCKALRASCVSCRCL